MKKANEQTEQPSPKLIGELCRAAHIYFQHQFRTYSIGHAQVRTLYFISINEGFTQNELAAKLYLDKSSVTSQLKILENNGYIQKKASTKDARMQRIYITDKTHAVLEPIKEVLSNWTETLMDGFSDTERTEAFGYLLRMRNNAKAKIEQLKNNL